MKKTALPITSTGIMWDFKFTLRDLCKYIVLFFSIILLLFFIRLPAMATGSSPLNFLLITIDTIRPDHLGCYGYKKIKTPHIDRLAQEGVLFENAFSPVPLTLPSHASILTGTYPAFHGVRNNGTYALSDSAMTLPELLKNKGYATAAFISAYVMDKRFGLDHGFDEYNDDLSQDKEHNIEYRERRAEDTTQEAIKWLKKRGSEKFFLWVHYFDPHMHYNPPSPYADQYAKNLYDGEIAYTDHWIGILLETMHKGDVAENTLIILTGDHGEGLGEHKEKTHGLFIYDTTLRVPLIFRYPKIFQGPKQIDSLVRLIDIAPTILAMVDGISYADMQGVSLLSLMKGTVKNLDLTLYRESLYPQFSHNWSPLEGIRTEKWKYIEAPIKELFNVDNDPHEKKNIFTYNQEEAEKLAIKLSTLKNTITSPQGLQDSQRISLDKEAKERLESLGYVFKTTTAKEKREYPDPKKMIALLEYYDQGLEYFGKRDYKKALKKFKKIVKKYPQDSDAHTILGHTYEALGEHEKSIASFEEALRLGCMDLRIYSKLASAYMKLNQHEKAVIISNKALEINPKCEEAYINLALYHYKRNEPDKAEELFKKALELDPRDVLAFNHVAVIYQKKGRYDEAISACESALSIDPHNVSALLTLGSTLLYKNKNQEALDALQKVLVIDPGSVLANYFAGLATFKQNRLDKAIEYFRKTTELKPKWAEPHFNLGFIYHKQGEFTKAKEEYQITLKLNPNLLDAKKMLEQLK
ncbi:MAG: sulfatase-like hydrolase/transferase [bacterium]